MNLNFIQMIRLKEALLFTTLLAVILVYAASDVRLSRGLTIKGGYKDSDFYDGYDLEDYDDDDDDAYDDDDESDYEAEDIDENKDTEKKSNVQYMITNKMRKVLTRDLQYLSEEVDQMEPQIAAVVIERELSRPIKGMPDSWRRKSPNSKKGDKNVDTNSNGIQSNVQRFFGASREVVTKIGPRLPIIGASALGGITLYYNRHLVLDLTKGICLGVFSMFRSGVSNTLSALGSITRPKPSPPPPSLKKKKQTTNKKLSNKDKVKRYTDKSRVVLAAAKEELSSSTSSPIEQQIVEHAIGR